MEKKSDGLPFKWGKKRGPGGVENKDVQYYESFTYGGCEYCLYDCVSVGDDSQVHSFVGKIIKMWEYVDQRQDPRRVELLWFFKPSELSLYFEGVEDVLANELFLASGSGLGLTNENLLEAISGKCHVLCISKDVRNPQPSEEEIKSADFLFHRTYDVGTSRILDKIDDNVAGVDVEFIFNRTSSETKASALQKVATDIQGTVDSLKPYHSSTSGSVMQNKGNASDVSGHWKSDNGYKKEQDNECHKQLASKKSTLAEESSNKDSGRDDAELDSFSASGSRRYDEGGNQFAKQKPRLADERCSKDSYRLDDMIQKKRRVDGSLAVPDGRYKVPQKIRNDGRKNTEPIRRDAMVSKSRLADERGSNDFYGLDVMPLKKPRVEGSVAVSEGRTRESQCTSHDGKKDVMVEKSRVARERYNKDCILQKKLELNGSAVVSDGRSKMSKKLSHHDGRKDPRDKVTREEVYFQKPSFTDKSQDLRIPRCSEGKVTKHVRFAEGKETRHVRFSEGKESKLATEKGLIKNSNPDCKISKHSEEKMLTNADYRRHYQVSEVTQKPNVVSFIFLMKQNFWEEDLRCAEGKGTLVVLRNLDPSYTSNEVENIVYSALNEQCTSRMIERTSATIPHIGEALVIFETMDVANRVIRRLHDGCLLLSNGRVLIATSAKVNPPAMPSLPFPGHINTQRRGKRSAAVTSHCSQGNNVEFDMCMEWWLHLGIYKQIWETIYERQVEEKKKLQLDVEPKQA
ncbi:unnamed protein product [Eruca vesicaria subsp. sativa]|uniref:BAH domain-containing protein n=1 Tax=Eruca vesicaria subsp. sativa TaxID=29727 RepID=A0ABC8L0W2_ERUVS|nr:unnamed protein product [Eruca vesicaria subsp. sativa]